MNHRNTDSIVSRVVDIARLSSRKANRERRAAASAGNAAGADADALSPSTRARLALSASCGGAPANADMTRYVPFGVATHNASQMNVAVALLVLLGATVLVAALPQLLHHAFTPINSALVGQGLLSMLGVVCLVVARRLDEKVQRAVHVSVLLVLLWLPFVFFVIDAADPASVTREVETNVILGVCAFLFGAASMNLVRTELFWAPSLLSLWVSSVGFVGHLCLAFDWRWSGARDAGFFALVVVLALVAFAATTVVVRVGRYVSSRIGLSWREQFSTVTVVSIATECVAVLALAQARQTPPGSVVVPVVAMLWTVFWGLMVLDAAFRIVWRLTYPLTSRVPRPQTSVGRTMVGVISLATFVVTAEVRETPGWIVLASSVVAVWSVPSLLRREAANGSAYAFDLFVVGACAITMVHTRLVPWNAFAPSLSVLALVVAVRAAAYVRSALVVATQLSLLVAAFVNAFAALRAPDDAFALAALAIVGLASIPWMVYWLLSSLISAKSAGEGSNGSSRAPPVWVVAGGILLTFSFVGLVVFSVVFALSPPPTDQDGRDYQLITIVGFLTGLVVSAMLLTLYAKCVVRTKMKGSV